LKCLEIHSKKRSPLFSGAVLHNGISVWCELRNPFGPRSANGCNLLKSSNKISLFFYWSFLEKRFQKNEFLPRVLACQICTLPGPAKSVTAIAFSNRPLPSVFLIILSGFRDISGLTWSCPYRESASSDILHTSVLSDDMHQLKDRSMIDNVQGLVGKRDFSRRPPFRSRAQLWHPYGPVEPPFNSSRWRPIELHTISYPPVQPAAETTPATSPETLNLPRPSIYPRPPPRLLSTRLPVYPSVQQTVSSRSCPRAIMNSGLQNDCSDDQNSGQTGFAHFPLPLQTPLLWAQCQTTSNFLPPNSARLPLPLRVSQPPAPTPWRPTPDLGLQRTSSDPSSFKAYSSIGCTPLSATSASGLPSPTANETTKTISIFRRTAPVMLWSLDFRHKVSTEEVTGTPPQTGSIPCMLDFVSGSSSQAEKRKANKDASRRYRNRKWNRIKLEQRLVAHGDEIKGHGETIRRQREEIRTLVQHRDHYHSERHSFP
jgi:hypothetical protein